MAYLLSPSLILSFSVSLLLIFSPALSLTCTSQKYFTNSPNFANCADLSSLGAYLHWTYDTAKNSLSIAFIAPPAEPSGWIAWGINPTGTGMLGTQSLLAFKQSDGSMAVDTYNISSYAITPSNILFDDSNLRAEDSGGMMKIFATLALPQNTREVFQVWQVGVVTDGIPDGHELQPENMNAKGTLRLVVEAQRNGTNSGNDHRSTTNNSTGGQRESAPVKGGISMISKKSNAVFCVCMLVLGILALFN